MAKPKPTPGDRALMLQEAASYWSALCKEIEEAEHLEPAIVAHFKEVKLEVERDVDRVITVMNRAKMEEDEAEGLRKFWQDRRDRIKAMRQTGERVIKEVLKANPDQPFKGSLGELKLKMHGGQPTLIIAPEIQWKDKTVRDVIEPRIAFELDIPDRFLKRKWYVSLDREAVREALTNGEELPWARLERGQGVSFPRPKKTETSGAIDATATTVED